MIVETSILGRLEINEDQVYHFSKGIPGFGDETTFAVVEVENGGFAYLQSLQSAELSFLLADPFLFYPSYEFELPDAETEELEIKEEVLIRSIVTLKESLDESTINLLAPVVLNPQKRLGKQVVLHYSSYKTRHPLWAEKQIKEGESSC